MRVSADTLILLGDLASRDVDVVKSLLALDLHELIHEDTETCTAFTACEMHSDPRPAGPGLDSPLPRTGHVTLRAC